MHYLDSYQLSYFKKTFLIMRNKSFYILAIAAYYILLSACSYHDVKPWQKSELSQSEMQFNSNPVETSFEEHFYFSKEGSSGGIGFSGGGCGCN
jgi:hypothetical protein